MARAHITARVAPETKEFFETTYAKQKKVKGAGRALDEAAKELGAKTPAPKKK